MGSRKFWRRIPGDLRLLCRTLRDEKYCFSSCASARTASWPQSYQCALAEDTLAAPKLQKGSGAASFSSVEKEFVRDVKRSCSVLRAVSCKMLIVRSSTTLAGDVLDGKHVTNSIRATLHASQKTRTAGQTPAVSGDRISIKVEEGKGISQALLAEDQSWKRMDYPVGLYGYSILRTAAGFKTFTLQAIEKSEALIHKIRLLPPSPEVVEALDDISNTVCAVLDAAELCRNTHTDPEYVRAANEAVLELSEYVQRLNMNEMLYRALVRTLASGCQLSEEALRVASMLRMDFERGGVHLPEEKRDEVNRLNLEITKLGMRFGQNISEHHSSVDIYPASALSPVPASVKALFRPIWRARKQSKGSFEEVRARLGETQQEGRRVPTDQLAAQAVLKWVGDAGVRKSVYAATYSTPTENLRVLDDLIAARHNLAQVLGYGCYTDFMLAPLMARSPATVEQFLAELSESTRTKGAEDLALLKRFKKKQEPSGDGEINAWDRGYFMGMAKANIPGLTASALSAYFPLERCLDGLAELMRALFRVELRSCPMAPGEGWAPDLLKFSLTHEDEGELGHIYLDLYPRPGKFPHNAHFTIQCGRRRMDGPQQPQLPLVALVCNFPKPLASAPSLLSHSNLETLFHEFGHALHSLLSRTHFQHLAGTRAALDFVEIPSNLMEYFVWDHRLLARFARHHSTHDPIPPRLVTALSQSKSMFATLELQNQVMYALMDQKFFGPQPLPAGGTTAIVAELQERHMGERHLEGTHWQSRFTHLVGYGGGYYSYLYAKCFAAQLWATYFRDDPLSSETGTLLWKGLLQNGGEKDPAGLLRGVLGEAGVLADPMGGVRPPISALLEELKC